MTAPILGLAYVEVCPSLNGFERDAKAGIRKAGNDLSNTLGSSLNNGALAKAARSEVGKVASEFQTGGTTSGRNFTSAAAEALGNSGMADVVGRELAKAAPAAERSGRDAGSMFNHGMRLSLIQNSPMIAAAVGGALVAGTPAALAGASLLFGRIGAVALKENEKVKAAWTGLGNHITNRIVGRLT